MAAAKGTVSMRTLVSECVDLARRAGGLIREVSASVSKEDMGLVNKGEAAGVFDPQTLADRKAQQCIVENLRALYGSDLRIVGEEGDLGAEGAEGLAPADGRLLDGAWPAEQDVHLPLGELCVWVDPLDGTREFTEGRYEYVSTLVGISQKGTAVAGVISEPYGGDGGSLLWGCRLAPGEGIEPVGARLLGDAGWRKPARPDGRCIALKSRSRSAGLVAEALERLQGPGSTGPLREGRALVSSDLAAGGAGHKVARLVDGSADLWLFPRPGTSRWDVCAAEALLRCQGGELLDGDGNRFVYDPDGNFGNDRGVVAGADGGIVSDTLRVCATLDVARDGEGKPLSRGYLESLLGNGKRLLGFSVAQEAVRGPHASVLRLEMAWDGEGPETAILKRVVPKDLSARPARKWRRDAESYRAEVNFLARLAPKLSAKGVRLPAVYCVEDEGMAGLALEADDEAMVESVMACRFLIFAEDLHPDRFRQELELQGADLRAALCLAGRLHGATFEDSELLTSASAELWAKGCYWGPEKRDPLELQGLPQAYGHVLEVLKDEAPDFLAQAPIAALGQRLQSSAAFVTKALQGEGFTGKCLVHGDFKTANIFISKADGSAVPIDFQWTGVNYGAQDLAYLLLGSSALSELQTGADLEQLLSCYFQEFKAALGAAGSAAAYGEEDLRRHFKLACLEYSRIIFGYQLKGRDLAWIRQGATTLGRCTHNSSPETLLGLMAFLDKLLAELEGTGDLSGKAGSMPGFER